MSGPKKVSDKLYAEIRRIDRRAELWREFWRTVKWVSIAICTYLSISELAGKETIANVIVSFFASLPERGVSPWFMYLAFMTSSWAFAERYLRRVKVASMAHRLKELEKLIDPSRSSSGLTPE